MPQRGCATRITKMKRGIFYQLGIAVTISAMLLCSCSKKTVEQTHNPNPFGGGAYEVPCQLFDTDEYWASTGFASGPASQKGALQLNAIKNAQDAIALKIKHVVNVEAGNQQTTTQLNNLTDIDNINRTIIVNTVQDIVNDAKTACLMFSPVDDRGNIECYVAIQIPKEDIYNALIKKTKDSQNLSDDYKAKRIKEYESERDRIMNN